MIAHFFLFAIAAIANPSPGMTQQAISTEIVAQASKPCAETRDRAGCNISDCGVFTRKQRMRMVPKFIELASQPNLSPQMRGWCFMALREITDENLPSDADAWNRWHADHGAERMAEFERIEWWQVRGDESLQSNPFWRSIRNYTSAKICVPQSSRLDLPDFALPRASLS